ncbi:DNA gyrase inhibitor YacG [Rhodoligotrophos defluvii]|uniref:DNA gyrase inhibitor YacG n=1 Tax=Rhodoligotrophos defluvii TaxID=2561934 RepID=UPI0010C9C2F7|nr:DNA gyrase inhibitor YacG [Rhodoligotrophos defluvii]
MSTEKKTEAAEPVRLRPRRPCPICGKPSAQKYHPFCSARCADVDLHRWLGGHYRIPGSPDTDAVANDDEPES